MKSVLATILVCALFIGLSASAMPDDRVVETVECKLKEGKTMDDVHAANGKWVKFMNANVQGGDIQSYVLTPQVGGIERGLFMYADSYPSLESWAAGDKATDMETYKPIQEELRAAADCTKNSLYKSRPS